MAQSDAHTTGTGGISVFYRPGVARVLLGEAPTESAPSGGKAESEVAAERAGAGGPVLDASAVRALHEHLKRCNEDESVRVVLLSSPTEHFCLGMDLAQASESSGTTNAYESIHEAVTRYSQVLELLETGSFVSIAAVHGHTVAGGMGLAAACSVVLAADTARFSLPEVLYGLVAANVFPALRRRISRGSCEYLALSRACWSAQTAHTRGLVDEVVAEDTLHTRSRRIIRDVLRNDPDAMSATRAFLRRMDEHGPVAARGEAVELLTERIMREDSVEAIRSLAQGRLPPWSMKMPKEFP